MKTYRSKNKTIKFRYLHQLEKKLGGNLVVSRLKRKKDGFTHSIKVYKDGKLIEKGMFQA